MRTWEQIEAVAAIVNEELGDSVDDVTFADLVDWFVADIADVRTL